MGVKVTVKMPGHEKTGYGHEAFDIGGLRFRPIEMPDGSIHLQFYRLSEAPVGGRRKVHVGSVTLQLTPMTRHAS